MKLPDQIVKYLQSYDINELDWNIEGHRYQILIEVICKGRRTDIDYVYKLIPKVEIVKLFKKMAGRSIDRSQRKKIRNELGISIKIIPDKPSILWS